MSEIREVKVTGAEVPSQANLPTTFGEFSIRVFHEDSTGFDHVALCIGAGRPNIINIKNNYAKGIRSASDFLMSLQSGVPNQNHPGLIPEILLLKYLPPAPPTLRLGLVSPWYSIYNLEPVPRLLGWYQICRLFRSSY